MATAKATTPAAEPTVTIYLPLREKEGAGSAAIDQTESVGINGKTWVIKRGEPVDVPVSVFEVLYHSGRYPGI